MSNNQAGKGDKLRKGADLKKYWDNYDRIFNKDKQKNENHTETTSKDNTNK
jgi:hypothetical protein